MRCSLASRPGAACGPSGFELVQVTVEVVGEAADQAGELAAFLGRPVGEQRGEPLVAGEEEALDRFLAPAGEAQAAGARVVGVTAPADQAQATEALGLTGDGRG